MPSTRYELLQNFESSAVTEWPGGRVAANEDILHIMLDSSDPFINSFRRKPKTNAASIDE